jgi:hypothetical protein
LVILKPAAVASIPTIKAISWTRAFVSRAFVVVARSWESLAWRHGCVETWTLWGSECDIVDRKRGMKEYREATWGLFVKTEKIVFVFVLNGELEVE